LFTPSFAIRAETPKRETVTSAEIEAGAAKFDGQMREVPIENEDSPKEELFRKYGTRTYATFKKHPELVAALRKLNPKFDPQTMATSSPNCIATINGKTLLILSGCFPHNCGGTEHVVVFDPATKRVYLLQPTNVGPDTKPSGKFYVYGDPDDAIRAAMYKACPL
jgi:hypothetical protein